MNNDSKSEAPGVNAPVTTPKMSIIEQIMHCTVRLEMPELGGRTGTGFFFLFFQNGAQSFPVIITNKHVIDGASTVQFRLSEGGDDGLPQLGKTISMKVGDFSKRVVYHPDADLCGILIGDIISQAQRSGHRPLLIPLTASLIPTKEQLHDLSPLEAVLTAGYPGQLWDDLNNLPIFHRGYTATPPYVNFKGNKDFLVDFATWPGASGSPIFIYNDGSYFDKKTNSIMLGSRIYLIGVVYGVAVQEVTGAVVIAKAPLQFDQTNMISATNVPTNLGVCLQAARILELEKELFKIGVWPPSGYKFRDSL